MVVPAPDVWLNVVEMFQLNMFKKGPDVHVVGLMDSLRDPGFTETDMAAGAII